MPLNAEMAPYDLTIVPNGASGSPENEPIVVDERPPMVLAARRGAKSIQRSERQERRLKSILEDMRAQGVKLALPKSLLDRAPLRLRNDDTKLATQVEEPQVGDRFTNSGTKTSLILGCCQTTQNHLRRRARTLAEDHLSPTQSKRRTCHPRLATSHDPS